MRISYWAVLPLLVVLGCGGDDSAPGTVEGEVRPCNQGEPSFDVWRADFAPNGRTQISAQVDTLDSATAAEFRLVVACQGEIVEEEIDGRVCTHQPPQRGPGDTPECPLILIDVEDLDFDDDDPDGRIECLVEIGTTESLDIGTGGCTDAAAAGYRLRMQIDAAALALDVAADDCRDEESCLESMFGLE